MQFSFTPVLRRRLTAYLIDLLVVMGIVTITLMVAIFAYSALKYDGDRSLTKSLLTSPDTKAFARLSHAIFFFSYFTLGHWYFGQTVGKWAMGLKVTCRGRELSIGNSLLRSLGYLVSGSFTFGLGYLPALFRRDERTLHDLLAHTEVVSTRGEIAKTESPAHAA